VKWEHEGTITAMAGTTADTVGDCHTAAMEVGADVPHVACRPRGTLVVHPLNHLLKVLT
jgi:hypothetical protein